VDSCVALKSIYTFKHIFLKLLERTSQLKHFASSLSKAGMLRSRVFKPLRNHHSCHYCCKAEVMKVNRTAGTFGKPNVKHILELLHNFNTKKTQPKETVLLLLQSHNALCVLFSYGCAEVRSQFWKTNTAAFL